MGLEHVGFLWYMRRISPWAALGFAAGMGYMAFMEVGLASQVVLPIFFCGSSTHMFGFVCIFWSAFEFQGISGGCAPEAPTLCSA